MTTTTDARLPDTAGTLAPWTGREDAIIRATYPMKGAAACVPLLPGRTRAAVQYRARKIKARRDRESLRAARIAICVSRQPAATAAARQSHEQASTWTPPGPRYQSVWAMAQGVTA